MSRQPVRPARVAPRHLTSAVLTGGVIVSAACYLVAVLAEVLGVATAAGDATDLRALIDGLLVADPWAWASLGTLVLVATPALALVVTAVEYTVVGDRGSAVLALVVLAILALSAVVAILR